MALKLFLSTFALIFLAELGDKTQLAAMARTASAQSGKWIIFTAASCALVTSTLLAVLFGSALTRIIPEYVIRMASGILFILFGILIFREAFGQRAAAIAANQNPSVLARIALRAAAQFEQAAADDYRRLAEAESNPALKKTFEALALEEERHLNRLLSADKEQPEANLPANAPSTHDTLALTHDVASQSQPVLAHAIEHEQATAAFYRQLAETTTIPSLKSVFTSLADEEDEHVRRLSSLS